MGDYETDHSMVNNINWDLGHENYQTDYQPRSKRKLPKEGDLSKKVVWAMFFTILAFTAVIFYFSWHGKYVPDVLINRFFIAILGEYGVLGAIKIAKVFKNK